jgi:SAM-dependent methyltransferase
MFRDTERERVFVKTKEDSLRETVSKRYGEAVKAALDGASGGCCGPTSSSCASGTTQKDPITRDLYSKEEAEALPPEALLASFGCGNPTALLELEPGQVVLDLGSGGGIDVLLSAKRVGPTGKAYGLDMTAEMLELARENQRKAGVTNVEFLKGAIEAIPLPDASVDVIISNCVINLSGDKDRVLAESFRVLRPGGRFAVSDVVSQRPVPDEVRRNMELWTGCIAGALDVDDYRARLERAGFTGVEFEIVREYRSADARSFLEGAGLDVDALAPQIDGAFASAFIRAVRPHAAA